MYYKYLPYRYYRQYYRVPPYYYNHYYTPYYNSIENQIASVNNEMINYGDMTDVIQNTEINQSMCSAPPEEPGIIIETPPEPV